MNRAQLMTSAAILRSPESDAPGGAAPQDAPLPTSLDALGKLGATSSDGPIGIDTTTPPEEAPAEEAPALVKPEGMSDEDWTLFQDFKKTKDAPAEEAPKDEPAAEVPFDLPHADKSDEELTALLTEQGGFAADPKYISAAIEFERTGTVSEATLAKTAEAFGIPVEMAKSFVDGQKAIRIAAKSQAASDVDSLVATVHEAVGGKEAFASLNAWAATNKADPTLAPLLEEYNNSTDAAHAKRVLGDIQARYKEAGNGAPRDVTQESGRGPTTKGGVQPYASDAEMHRDQNDRRYQTDPAFRDQVMARARVTK